MEWKQVKGYEGLYEVSRCGKVRTVKRIYLTGEFYHPQLLPQKILSPKIDKDGYLSVALRKNGLRNHKRIHRLVCDAFHDNPLNKPLVNHINGNKSDNRAENLEWCTASENELHSFRVLGKKPSIIPPKYGTNHHGARGVLQIDANGKVVKKYDCISFAKKDGFNPQKIYTVAGGHRKTHGGYKWQYT